jgi:hypothetical protein
MIYSNPTVESIAKLFTQVSARSLAVPLRDDDVFTAVQSYRAQVDSILDEHRAMFEGSVGNDLDSDVTLDHSL